MEDLGNQYCAYDQSDPIYDFTFKVNLYCLLFIMCPFASLTIFDKRLRKHMDPLLWYFMVIQLAISIQGVANQLICENTFNNLFRTTFLNLIDVYANDNKIRGLFYYSG